jgi:TIR domain
VSAPIFISYSSKDQKIAETICRALEARGLACWIAARDVGAGENFQEAIVKALRGARLMLLVFTSNANNSNEIKKEVVLAGRHHITVVPVRVEDVAPNDALAYEFATRQWIDLFTDWEREMERLVSQIGTILTDRSTTDKGERGEGGAAYIERRAPTAPVVKTSPFRSVTLVIPIVIVLALASGAYLYTRPAVQPSSPASAPASSAPVPPSPAVAPASQSSADERAWQDAANFGTVHGFKQYLGGFPIGAHVEEARQRIQAADDHAWANATGAGTIVALDQYTDQFPDGAHAAQARSNIAALEQQATAETERFDGAWQATISCPTAAGAQGYVVQFPARVTGRVFHGQQGADDTPGWLSVDGKIQLDGSVELYAHGLTSAGAFTVGNVPSGSPVGYHILARFDGSNGTGSRVELRPCKFTALKR